MRASVAVDVPTYKSPFSASLPNGSRQEVERIGWALDRDVRPFGEAIALVRRPLPATLDERGSSGPLLDALETLDPALLRRMATEGVTAVELPASVQRELLRIADTAPGLLQRLVDGEPVGVGVYGDAYARGKDPASGETMRLPVTEPEYGAAVRASERATGKKPSAPNDAFPERTRPAAISFPEGEVLTLDALVSRIRTELKTNLEYDDRLAEASVFVKGDFTQDEILGIARTLARADAPVVAEWSRVSRAPRIEGLIGRLGGDLLSGREGAGKLTDEDMRSRRVFGRSELAELSPTFARATMNSRFDANTDLRLEKRFGISLFAPGQSVFQNGSPSLNLMNWVIEP